MKTFSVFLQAQKYANGKKPHVGRIFGECVSRSARNRRERGRTRKGESGRLIFDSKTMFGKNQDPQLGKATQFPHQIRIGKGQPPVRKFRQLLDDLAKCDDVIQVSPADITAVKRPDGSIMYYELRLPTEQAIAANLQRMSARDVRWFEQLAKIKGLYAPTKVAETDVEGNDKMPKEITINIIHTTK